MDGRDCGGDDCDDDDPTRFEAAPELCDGLDNDCNYSPMASEEADLDGDGVRFCADCDDLQPIIGVDDGCRTGLEIIQQDLGPWTPLPPLTAIDPAGVNPADPVDYWELRSFDNSVWPEVWNEILAQDGTLCGGASDTDACRDAFDALTVWVGFDSGCLPLACWKQIAWTSGDATGVVGWEELPGFLGAPKAADEVALRLAGLQFGWDDLRPAGYRATATGWLAFAWQGRPVTDGYARHVVLLEIDRDGEVTELRAWIDAVSWGDTAVR